MTVTKKGPAPTKTEQKKPNYIPTKEEQTYLNYWRRFEELSSKERFNEVFEAIGDEMSDPQYYIDSLTNLFIDYAPKAEAGAGSEEFNASAQSIRAVIDWLRILRNNKQEKEKCLKILQTLQPRISKALKKPLK